VTVKDADEFSLDGSVGTGAGAGASGNFYETAQPAAFAQDFSNHVFTYDTDGGGDAALTVKFASSMQEDPPDFAKAQSVTNQYDFADVVDTQNGASIDGDTGVAVAGADDHRQFELNINAARWVGAIVTGGTAGEITLTLRMFNYN
jgi:hypothetical protein